MKYWWNYAGFVDGYHLRYSRSFHCGLFIVGRTPVAQGRAQPTSIAKPFQVPEDGAPGHLSIGETPSMDEIGLGVESWHLAHRQGILSICTYYSDNSDINERDKDNYTLQEVRDFLGTVTHILR